MTRKINTKQVQEDAYKIMKAWMKSEGGTEVKNRLNNVHKHMFRDGVTEWFRKLPRSHGLKNPDGYKSVIGSADFKCSAKMDKRNIRKAKDVPIIKFTSTAYLSPARFMRVNGKQSRFDKINASRRANGRSEITGDYVLKHIVVDPASGIDSSITEDNAGVVGLPAKFKYQNPRYLGKGLVDHKKRELNSDGTPKKGSYENPYFTQARQSLSKYLLGEVRREVYSDGTAVNIVYSRGYYNRNQNKYKF